MYHILHKHFAQRLSHHDPAQSADSSAFRLKRSSSYYTQVQAQLACLHPSITVCDFVVRVGLSMVFVETIEYDPAFAGTLVGAIARFCANISVAEVFKFDGQIV